MESSFCSRPDTASLSASPSAEEREAFRKAILASVSEDLRDLASVPSSVSSATSRLYHPTSMQNVVSQQQQQKGQCSLAAGFLSSLPPPAPCANSISMPALPAMDILLTSVLSGGRNFSLPAMAHSQSYGSFPSTSAQIAAASSVPPASTTSTTLTTSSRRLLVHNQHPVAVPGTQHAAMLQRRQERLENETQREAARTLDQFNKPNKQLSYNSKSQASPLRQQRPLEALPQGGDLIAKALASGVFSDALLPASLQPPPRPAMPRDEVIKTLKRLGSSNLRRSDPYIDCAALVKDFSRTTHSLAGPQRRRGGVAEPFPVKVARMLEETKKEGLTDVVSFSPHGRAFAVHNVERFVSDVMPRFFAGQTKWSSFSRQLNLWGFLRVCSPNHPDMGGFYHPLILEGCPELAQYMHRVGRPPSCGPSADKRPRARAGSFVVVKPENDGPDPNFYAMPSPRSTKRSAGAKI